MKQENVQTSWRIPKGMVIREIKLADQALPRLIKYPYPETDSSKYDVLEFEKK